MLLDHMGLHIYQVQCLYGPLYTSSSTIISYHRYFNVSFGHSSSLVKKETMKRKKKNVLSIIIYGESKQEIKKERNSPSSQKEQKHGFIWY